jgi:hypothetical protein
LHFTEHTDYAKAAEPTQDEPISLIDQLYLLIVFAPAWVYLPIFEFESGNSLRITGASGEYPVLNGVWEEVGFPGGTFFRAQVEESEPTTTTSAPETSGTLNESAIQIEPSQTTKFLINLTGVASIPIQGPDDIGVAIGTGRYLGAGVVFIGLTTRPGDEPAFGSITPESGNRESTLTDVEISCFNTTFSDDPSVSIQFNPPEGLTVSNINTISNTRVEFDLQIDVNAPTGSKTITVTWDTESGSPKTVSSSDAGKFFTVTE